MDNFELAKRVFNRFQSSMYDFKEIPNFLDMDRNQNSV